MTSSQDSTKLRDFIIENMKYLRYGAGWGVGINLPAFELAPLDYLRFAQKELGDETASPMSILSSLNCVGQLKRAADCAIDTFLHALKLYELFKKRNLKFEKKLELLNTMGIFNPRSLNKLNTMRNKMEHEYKAPISTNLELYFELIQGFIYALDGYIHMLAHDTVMEFESSNSNIIEDIRSLNMSVEYSFEKPSIIFKLEKNGKTDFLEFVASTDIENFAFAANLFFLLIRSKALISVDSLSENTLLAYEFLEKGSGAKGKIVG